MGGLAGAVVGVVGGVTDRVDDTVATVTQSVSATTQTAATTVTRLVDAAPAPVAAAVEPITSTTTAIVDTVATTASSVTVSGVVTPVVDTATALPLVGGIVDGIGLDGALTDAAASVDGALDAVDTVVGGITGELGASAPGAGEAPAIVVPGQSDPDAPAAGIAGPRTASQEFGAWFSAIASIGRALPALMAAPYSAVAGPSASSVALGAAAAGILSSALALGVCASGGGFPPGPSGAGPGALALAALSPFAAHRAWVRRRGWDDDVAPTAPVLGTDVSPD
jgi:hypothetical protein